MPKKAELGDEIPEGFVKIKITRFGAGQVSTGEHVSGIGDVMFEEGALTACDPSNAKRLETLGFAEII